MFCATCAKQIDEQDAFCRNCGRRVPSSARATPTPAAESDRTTGRFTVRHFVLLLLGVAIFVVWLVLRQPPNSSATRPAPPQPSQNQSNTQITPKEKEALGWLIRDAETVFDRAETVARGQAAYVDLRETRRNLTSLEGAAQGALADLDNKWVPDSLRPASQTFRSALLDLRKGTRLQLSYWQTGETSNIEPGTAKMKSGLETLNKFIEQTRAFMAARRP